VTPVATVFGVSVGIEPTQKKADAAVRQSYTGISRTVVEIDRIPVCPDGVAAGKYYVLDVSVKLSKHPRVSSDQAERRPRSSLNGYFR
jgi:hypothetical protein